MGQEIFPVMRGVAGMGQEKFMWDESEDPILRPRPSPLPSLFQFTKKKKEASHIPKHVYSHISSMPKHLCNPTLPYPI